MEFAATKVVDWPRQQTDEINWAVPSMLSTQSESVPVNLNDNTGMGKALW